jgi:hypothetical protein
MDLDWSALERMEMTSWLLPANRIFPYSVVIHGGQDRPNPDAITLAKKIMEYYDMFTTSAEVHLRALVNPKILEDGMETEAFHFSDYGNSFEIHLILEGDSSAHWAVRFVRRGGDFIGDYSPCELTRTEQ